MASGICPGCKRQFSRKGTGDFCTRVCRESHEERERIGKREVSKRMARGSTDSDAQRERAKGRAKRQKVEAEREQEAKKPLPAVLDSIAEHSRTASGTEFQVVGALRAVGDAKRAQDWTGLRHALVCLAGSAAAWAARIEAVDGADPLPPERALVPMDERDDVNGNGNGHGGSVAERYAGLLLDAAARDLDGPTARTTIERLLGVGL